MPIDSISGILEVVGLGVLTPIVMIISRYTASDTVKSETDRIITRFNKADKQLESLTIKVESLEDLERRLEDLSNDHHKTNVQLEGVRREVEIRIEQCKKKNIL